MDSPARWTRTPSGNGTGTRTFGCSSATGVGDLACVGLGRDLARDAGTGLRFWLFLAADLDREAARVGVFLGVAVFLFRAFAPPRVGAFFFDLLFAIGIQHRSRGACVGLA